MQWWNKGRKTIINFSASSNNRFRQPQNRGLGGAFHPEHLSSKGHLFIVAEGVNGRTDTREAREMVVNIINEVYYSAPSKDVCASLKQAFEEANTLIYELFNKKGHKQKVGISCTVLVLTKDRVYIAQIGDNRVYRITHDNVENLTETYPRGRFQKQFILTAEGPKAYLQRSNQRTALGLSTKIDVQINSEIQLETGDRYLLCSDGLVDVDTRKIKKIVLSNTPHQACKKLIHLAKKLGIKKRVDVQVIENKSFWAAPIRKIASPRRLSWLSTVFVIALAGAVTYDLNDSSSNEKSDVLNIKSEGLTDPMEYIMASQNEDALKFYREPAELRTDEEPIKQPIAGTEENPKPVPVLDKKNRIPEKAITKMSERLQPSRIRNIHPLKSIWTFPNLTNDDFDVKTDKIVFHETSNRKKAILPVPFTNINFEVRAKSVSNNLKGRFGIIIGYESMDHSPYESFYLFSVSKQKEFLLQKYSNFKKELITKISAEPEAMKNLSNIRVKIKCHGSALVLYVNEQRLYVFDKYENSNGMLGLYADSNLCVEFSEFEFSRVLNLKKIANPYAHNAKIRNEISSR